MTKKTNKTYDNGHWSFCEQIPFTTASGFVYLIRNKINCMMYIGKKNFRGAGKLNKGKQSNWRAYTGSSKQVNEDIEKLGKENFEFYILEWYINKGSVSYAEAWSQHYAEIPTNNDKFYNRFIDKVSWKVSEPITDRHKKRLKKLISSYEQNSTT
jgi:hypothetical protein